MDNGRYVSESAAKTWNSPAGAANRNRLYSMGVPDSWRNDFVWKSDEAQMVEDAQGFSGYRPPMASPPAPQPNSYNSMLQDWLMRRIEAGMQQGTPLPPQAPQAPAQAAPAAPAPNQVGMMQPQFRSLMDYTMARPGDAQMREAFNYMPQGQVADGLTMRDAFNRFPQDYSRTLEFNTKPQFAQPDLAQNDRQTLEYTPGVTPEGFRRTLEYRPGITPESSLRYLALR